MLTTLPMMCYISSFLMLSLSMLTLNLNTVFIMSWEITYLLSSNINMDLMLEWSSTMYSSYIMFISGNVLKFSKFYMSHDHNYARFTYIVLLFILSMNLLVYIPNIICLLIGWDGLGITSFILIIYYNNARSLGAGMLTILINRMGDSFLLMAITSTLETSNWSLLYITNNYNSLPQLLGIFTAAMTKSAQLPYSSWLPAAMAAPTPVSALVHSSTLVTAGIFLMYRFKNMILSSNATQTAMFITGLLTMMMAGFSAMVESDMKKIIALSTLSQLGLMLLCLGMKLFKLAFLHMSCHAIFKALLFIAAGNLIFTNHHNQDLRLYNKFSNFCPISSSTLLVSSMTMVGMPFMTGYYSKHAIMEWSLSPKTNICIYILLMLTIVLTSYYSTRLTMYTMTAPSAQMPMSANHQLPCNNHSMLLMSVASIISGSMMQWLIPLMPLEQHNKMFMSYMMNLLILLSMLLMYLISMNLHSHNNPMQPLITFLMTLSYLTPLLTSHFPSFLMNLSLNTHKNLDQSWLEVFIGSSLSATILKTSSHMNILSSVSLQKTMMITALSISTTTLMLMVHIL